MVKERDAPARITELRQHAARNEPRRERSPDEAIRSSDQDVHGRIVSTMR